jgi:hypothetical protein
MTPVNCKHPLESGCLDGGGQVPASPLEEPLGGIAALVIRRPGAGVTDQDRSSGGGVVSTRETRRLLLRARLQLATSRLIPAGA